MIVADRAARTPNGIKLLVQLAEALQAPRHRPGQPHELPATRTICRAPPSAVASADVILGLELTDFWGTVNA